MDGYWSEEESREALNRELKSRKTEDAPRRKENLEVYTSTRSQKDTYDDAVRSYKRERWNDRISKARTFMGAAVSGVNKFSNEVFPVRKVKKGKKKKARFMPMNSDNDHFSSMFRF